MARVRVIHWRAAEAQPLLKALRDAGHEVQYEERPDYSLIRVVRETKPDAVVIDLSRVPSHGREVAVLLRATKSTRHVPIAFVGGEEEKVAKIREVLPDATYTSLARIASAVKKLKPPTQPVIPEQMMARFHARTTAQKMGIAENSRVALYDAPPDYERVLSPLPSGVSLEEEPSEALPVTLWFVRDHQDYIANLRRRARLAMKSRLWIVWPKGIREINGNQIRESALAMGLVDYKICSVNEIWTAMVFAVKKA